MKKNSNARAVPLGVVTTDTRGGPIGVFEETGLKAQSGISAD
ncbi:hypothetical protein [Allosphingosinicella indica]|uniref:Uncharacterized protein n=1 Tax=Allosphingosinicella indica TaxID=941907 RepID=A0A1X7FY93_9SPHN|nr:hypothetical protein [Allosphingosinicella indica]SMF61000.1 hypothetical protein SAMN06295910_0093 [Allosphingosinicella indica]